MTDDPSSKQPTLNEIRIALLGQAKPDNAKNDILDKPKLDFEKAVKVCAEDEWWTWPEALTWIARRDYNDLATLNCWAEFFSESKDPDFVVGGQYQIALQACSSMPDGLERALCVAIEQGRVTTIGRKRSNGPLEPLDPMAWRGSKVAPKGGRMLLINASEHSEIWAHDVGVNRQGLLIEFPPPPKLKPTHAEVVEWCLAWMRAGNGYGEDKAWPAFTADPKHKGLSRDHVFRPAWRDAKAIISKA